MTAALGVILDQSSNTQKFFGGGEAETTNKIQANDMNVHTNDIMALAISQDRSIAVSGQVGSAPVIFAWDACSGVKKQRFKLGKGARGVAAVAISADASLIACVDMSNDHVVSVFDLNSGALVKTDKGDTEKIFDICFSAKPGD